jgi:hypothetical protein
VHAGDVVPRPFSGGSRAARNLFVKLEDYLQTDGTPPAGRARR